MSDKKTSHDPNVKLNLIKKIKNTCVTLLSAGWLTNPAHHEFNPGEPGSR